MRILLIDPVTTARTVTVAERRQLRQGIGYPGLGLLTIAALTPADVEVRYVDESVEPLDLGATADLVGITVQAPTAPYVYELAASYRRRGIPVVLGGIHASLNPGEALPHADAVVIGEGELSWPRLVEDFRRGDLRRVYRAGALADLDTSPVPRRDLLRRSDYMIPNVIQASKSCPFGCEFCSLHAYTGYEHRYRTVSRVIEEIRAMSGTTVLFADDNLYASRDFTLELCRGLASLRKRWVAEATWQIAYDQDALAAARESGCVGLFVGFDSINRQRRMAKVPRRGDIESIYIRAIRRIQEHGIAVVAAFVFGLDNDDAGVFERSVDVARRGGANLVNFSTLIPYPGTPLFRRLREEGRITEWNWSRYISPHVCFEPRRMSAKELLEGTRWAQGEFYSLRGVARTAADTVFRMGWAMGLLGLRLNLAQRRNWGRGSQAVAGVES